MGEMLNEALKNGKELNEQLLFVIDHAYKVAQFRQIKEYGTMKDQIFRKIDRDEDKGLKLGFTVSEIRGINHFILQKDQEGQLEFLFQKLKEKGAK